VRVKTHMNKRVRVKEILYNGLEQIDNDSCIYKITRSKKKLYSRHTERRLAARAQNPYKKRCDTK